MLRKKDDPKTTLLEDSIAAVHAEMATLTADSPEFAACVKQLQELYKIKDPKVESRVHLKDWIPVIGSFGGIALIVAYESFGNTLTSKAVGFVSKLRS